MRKILRAIPEILVIIFLITILWVLFLPHFESPFRIKLNVLNAKQVFMLTLVTAIAIFLANILLPRYLFQNRFKIVWLFLLNCGFTLCYFLSILNILDLPYHKISHRFGVVAQPLWSLFICSYSAVLGLLLSYYKNILAEKETLQQREKEMQEINILSIKSQLNPHFLFNILNNIDAHIHQHPSQASDMLINLSKLLRYVIYEDKEVTLSREIRFMEDYIALQTTRNQSKIVCVFNKNVANENMMIAPTIFLPYMENAFKYCDLSKDINTIFFSLDQEADNIKFIASNPTLDVMPSSGYGGKGLEIAQKRLQLFYPDGYSVLITKQVNSFIAKVDIWKK